MAMFAGISGEGLATGAQPLLLNGNEREEFASVASMPSRVSASATTSLAKKAGQLEGQAYVTKRWSKYAAKVATALTDLFSTRVAHTKTMSRAELRMQEITGDYVKLANQYNFDSSNNREYIGGYESQFDGVNVGF